MSDEQVTALVTGSAGFIGRHVCTRLMALGVEVIGIDNLEPRVHGEDPEGYMADVSEFHKVSYDNIPYSALRAANVVIHLAAQVGVADSMIDPVRYVEHNTAATARFLEDLAWAHYNEGCLHKLIVASSMSVYGYGDPDSASPINERYPTRPTSVYGLTKYDQEMLCKFWGKHQGFPTIALRFFNVFGPGQALNNPYTGVIANFANWLLDGTPPTVFEDGQQTRDFVYVDDVADAIVTAAIKPTFYDTYNICTSEPTTIECMARHLAAALDINIEPNITGEIRAGDVRHCIGNNSRFALEFDWAPRSVQEGLKLYAPWIHEQANLARRAVS